MAVANDIYKRKDPAIRTRTPLYLDNGVETDIVSFSGLCDRGEHIALVFPNKEQSAQKAPLVRLHSECLTGDVFGSAHCDCGNQLAEAHNLMSEDGGILIYLRQEGRGIGLYNKIDAYKVQYDMDMDTFEANRHIGFDDDPRNFEVAAQMLHALSIKTIKLLTNNPQKVAQLKKHGIDVVSVVQTGCFEKPANKHYLEAKRKHGHSV